MISALKNKSYLLQPTRMRTFCFKAILCFILGIAGAGTTLAQHSMFQSIAQDFDKHRKKALQEKLFLHLDRPTYACGETMWFKIYNVDGTLHSPLEMSKIAYVEVLNNAQKPVLQGKVKLEQGTGNSSFVLPATLSSGNYTVRAYTNWMKNFSPDFYFEQPVTIVNTFQAPDKQEATTVTPFVVHFFPEGGNMVAGIGNKVAFKAIDSKTGKGVNFTGEIFDHKGNKVADFKPHKFGIGSFTFIPQAGAEYIAKITLPGNKMLQQALPQVYTNGYTLQLQDAGAEQVKVTVNVASQQIEPVYLLGHTRQMIAYAEAATINNGLATFLINKSALQPGITHFTVFNAQKQPVCERLYFKQPTNNLQLSIAAPKQVYATREKVDLTLLAQANANGLANTSMAVYKLDSLQGQVATTIDSYLWLTSDLRGTIENPAYYFSKDGVSDTEAMDNLMLTHGWSRFNWDDILDKALANYSFIPEVGGHLITGKVTNKATGAPAPGILTYLSSPGKNARFYTSESDANGLVRYEVKDLFGAKDVVVQSNFTKDSTYHFELFSPFSEKFSSRKVSAFALEETLQPDLTTRHIQTQAQLAYFGNYTNRFKPSGVDNTPIYGKPSEHYKLDDYKRFKVMEEVMREYVPGVMVRRRKGSFHFMVINRPHKSTFENNPMVLMDGVPVFNIDKVMAFDPLKVEKLDVIASRYFNGSELYEGLVSYTTYKGDLGGFELDPRALMQEYEGVQLQREFYAPTYETAEQKQSRLADFRNLLHWEPTIKLSLGKETQKTFYTSDQPGTYMVVLQGLTANGIAGSKKFTFTVGQPL